MNNNFWAGIEARLNELNDIDNDQEMIDQEDDIEPTEEDILINEPTDDVELLEDDLDPEIGDEELYIDDIELEDNLVLEFDDIMNDVNGHETVDEIEDSIVDTIDNHDTNFNDAPISPENATQDDEMIYVWHDTTNFLVSAKRLTDVIADIIYQPEHYLPHVDDFNFTGRYNIMTINAVQGLVVSFEYESTSNTSIVEVIVQINDAGVEVIGAN